jgi:hydrogenase maturation protease
VTHRSAASRTVQVDQLARVEGEGALHVEITDGAVTDVQLRIFEPPRFFEAFLEGRAHTEPPDLTARICGICPVAYQMSACMAVEDACGVVVGGHLEHLRRILYCGEWVESHTLHVSMLHAPDFLGVASAIELAEVDRSAVERALAVKRAGNRLLEVIGGRAIHPVNVKVGGFHRLPRRRELTALLGELHDALAGAEAIVEWVSGFEFAAVEMDYRFVAAEDPGNYPVLGRGFVVEGRGPFAPEQMLEEVVEVQVPHSTALHARLADSSDGYLTGPLARYALFGEHLHPAARGIAERVGLEARVTNPCRSVIVRAVEVVHALSTAIDLIEDWNPGSDLPASVPVPPPVVETVGHGITEAPRGLLYHRYGIDSAGNVTGARIVPPTSQNQSTIEHDLWHVAEGMLAEAGDPTNLDDDELRHRCEVAIRNHDPCISCATHFLDLSVERRNGDGPVAPPSSPPLVVGIGNPFRRDDGVGPAVVSALRARANRLRSSPTFPAHATYGGGPLRPRPRLSARPLRELGRNDGELVELDGEAVQLVELDGEAVQLFELDGEAVQLVELDGEPTRLVELWAGRPTAVVVDAVRDPSARPGEVLVIRRPEELEGMPAGCSSHLGGIVEAVRLGRALDRMPERLVVVGVVAVELGDGPALSEAVSGSLGEATSVVRDLLHPGADDEVGSDVPR